MTAAICSELPNQAAARFDAATYISTVRCAVYIYTIIYSCIVVLSVLLADAMNISSAHAESNQLAV